MASSYVGMAWLYETTSGTILNVGAGVSVKVSRRGLGFGRRGESADDRRQW
jgi:hypothetical protein